MLKRMTAFLAVAVALVAGFALTATPASAARLESPSCYDRLNVSDITTTGLHWISAGTIGEVAVCYGDAVDYNDVTLGPILRVKTHDWTNDGVSIYVEYQTWTNSTWFTVPNSTDVYGGPATISDAVSFSPQQAKYVRVRAGASFSYLFKPRTGAGSGNGCGLEGEAAHNGMIACPAGSY